MSTYLYELLAVICYFIILLFIGITSYRRHLSATDFIIGNRSLNYWLTALAAHASDMSSWLFMGYPSVIITGGLFNAWAAVGLIVFMFLNWQLIAPKIRIATEQYNSLTFSSFFESRLADTSGLIRVFTAVQKPLVSFANFIRTKKIAHVDVLKIRNPIEFKKIVFGKEVCIVMCEQYIHLCDSISV